MRGRRDAEMPLPVGEPRVTEGPNEPQWCLSACCRELTAFCHQEGIPVAPSAVLAYRAAQPRGSKGSINALCEDFVAGMQDEAPSTVPTVLRSASKLTAFPFNHPSASSPPPVAVAFSCKPFNPLARGAAFVDSGGAVALGGLCRLCLAPLTPADDAATPPDHGAACGSCNDMCTGAGEALANALGAAIALRVADGL